MINIECAIRIYVSETLALDPFAIQLLKAIESTGSIQQAAKDLRISYQHAWHTLKTLNRAAPKPIVVLYRGGIRGGGAVISDYGTQLVRDYATIETIIQKTVTQIETEIAM